MFAEWKTFIGMVAGVVSFAAYLPYLVSILRRKTKPHRVTWLVLSAVVLITFGTYKSSGAENTLWLVVGDCIGVLSVAILSLWHGVGGRSRTDLACLCGAAIAMVLWIGLDSPVGGLIAVLTTDFLALWPTIVKTYRYPDQEDRLAWVLTFIGNVLCFFAVEEWAFAILVYPVYHTLSSGTVLGLTFRSAN